MRFLPVPEHFYNRKAMARQKKWKPHPVSREFVAALAPAIGAIDTRTDRRRVVIFCGAGFAKAWSIKSPLSKDLFSVPTSAFEHNESLLRLLEYLRQGETGHVDQYAMKDVATFLDLCEHHPFLRGELMDRYSATRLRAELGRAIKGHYRQLHYINDLKESDDVLPVKSNKSPHRKPIIGFLQDMLHDRCEYTEGNVGLDLCFVTTNYDYAVESWIQESAGHPVLEDLYRGFTPTRINGEENTQFLIDRPFSLKLLKLNGGFEIVEDHGGFALDYRNHQQTPVMVLPSSFQDYRSEYFQCVFEKAAIAFQQADVVLFVGYLFPREDLLIRRLTAMLVDSGTPRKAKGIFSISRKGKQSIEESLNATLGSRTCRLPQVSVYNWDFSKFCADCRYWYEKVRDGASLE